MLARIRTSADDAGMSSQPSRPPSLWWNDPVRPFPPLTTRAEGDVIVIGGGITGITLAWTLATQDARVVLIDAGWIAGAASGRNAGFLMAGPAEPYAELVAMYGRAGARAILQAGRRNHVRIRALIEHLSLECEHRVRGSVRLARTVEEAEDQRASIPLLREDGNRSAEVAVADVTPPHTAGLFCAAFFDPDNGELQPVRFLRGLAAAAAGRGTQVFEHSPVTGARATTAGWEVKTASGSATARTLVIATNAYAPRLCPVLEPLIRPRRGQMLSTAPLPHEIARRPSYAHWGYQYWRQAADGRLVIGGWRDLDLDGETGYDDETNERIQAAIEAGLRELVPEGTTIEHRWAGTMGFARDGRPLVGWLDAERHLAICAGFTGHGMGMAAACTEALAELLSFRDAPAIHTFAPSRFPELARHDGPFIALPG